jgi:hypothetical protein
VGKCNCAICKRSREIRQTIRDGDVEALRKLVKELQSDLMHAEEDAAYYKSIVYGDWPSADEIIAFARKKREADRA